MGFDCDSGEEIPNKASRSGRKHAGCLGGENAEYAGLTLADITRSKLRENRVRIREWKERNRYPTKKADRQWWESIHEIKTIIKETQEKVNAAKATNRI